MSLYRRYRPQTFDEVIGQDHVTRTLANAIAEDRLHHAYLFTGPRGTGKTSTARILAKAVNCVQGPTPTPCGTCDSCTDIAEGRSIDVIELDMASHGGVDDARELRDRATFAPARSRRRVYILDEVHMASTAAFNALLKLVEEPPGHVLFVMATTDPQKVLPTILSRVQRLDLRRVGSDDVAEQVRRVCAAEGHEIEPEAIGAIVRAGDGSMRDTLSVLEQVLAYADSTVTHTMVTQVLGTTPDVHASRVVDLIAAGDVGGVLTTVQELVDGGHDLRRFTLDLAQHARDLLVLRVAPDRPDLVDTTDDRRARLATQAAVVDQDALLEIVRVLSATVTEQRQTSPRLPLELALATLAAATPANRAPTAPTGATAEPDAPTPAPAGGEREVTATGSPDPRRGATRGGASESGPLDQGAPDPSPSDQDFSDPGPGDRAATDSGPRETGASASGEAGATPEPSPVAPEPAAAADVPEGTAHAGEAVDPDGATGLASDPTLEADASSAADAPSDADGLETVRTHWDGVLEAVRQQSRRCHALFEPAVPVRVGRGVITLRYARRYASFHAANARKAEFADVLRAALRARCGLDLRVDVVVEGEDDRRRPMPPRVTPDDARTPVLDDSPAARAGARGAAAPGPATPSGDRAPGQGDISRHANDQEADVREAEVAPASVSEHDVGRLLTEELGAELVEEVRPSGDGAEPSAR